jgi:iduronate 2-sulfatase
VSLGKVFHGGVPAGPNDDFPASWSEMPWIAPNTNRWCTYHANAPGCEKLASHGVSEDVLAEFPLIDTQVADEAIRKLEAYSETGEPWFLGVGFQKPHLPFTFPSRLLEHYPPVMGEALPTNQYAPPGLPPIAWQNSGELKNYEQVGETGWAGAINEVMGQDLVSELRRGYFASLSHMDEEVGRVLGALDATGQRNNTIVILFGDHGYQLGEHTMWVKHSNFHLATHVPLIVSVPPSLLKAGTASLQAGPTIVSKPVEIVDVYPTLADFAGLEVPSVCPPDSSAVELCTEGNSLRPLIDATVEDLEVVQWKRAAFSQYIRACQGEQLGCHGYSMQTRRWR